MLEIANAIIILLWLFLAVVGVICLSKEWYKRRTKNNVARMELWMKEQPRRGMAPATGQGSTTPSTTTTERRIV